MYISISIANFGPKQEALNRGFLFIMDDNGNKISSKIGYLEGCKMMWQTSKILNKRPEITVNKFSNTIVYKEVKGTL